MSDYGVDTPEWRALPWSWAAERLIANRNFWVVTVSGAGRPHAMPVWGVWDEDELRFAFSCSPRARKARNLTANPNAAVMVDDTVECVSLQGAAEPVTDEARRSLWAHRYLTKYRPMAPSLSAQFVLQHLVVEFRPDRGFAVIERDEEFATRATRWVFDPSGEA